MGLSKSREAHGSRVLVVRSDATQSKRPKRVFSVSIRRCSSVDRASVCGTECRRFESSHRRFFYEENCSLIGKVLKLPTNYATMRLCQFVESAQKHFRIVSRSMGNDTSSVIASSVLSVHPLGHIIRTRNSRWHQYVVDVFSVGENMIISLIER